MKILYIGLNPSGVGTFWRMFHFARHIVHQGHEVSMITMSSKNRWRIVSYTRGGVEIVETPDLLWGSLRSGWDAWEIINRIAWMRSRQFDLIHAFETRPTVLLPALFGKYAHKTPLIFDWCDWFGRGGQVEERTSHLQRFLLHWVDTFFEERFRHFSLGTTVICEALRQKAVNLGVKEEKIIMIRDGANVAELSPQNKMKSRKALSLPLNAPLIGYVGMIFPRDAKLMARAFDSVQSMLPQAKLLLIGYVNRPIKEMVNDASSVINTDTIPYAQLNQYIAACDLCWLPYCDSGANRGRWPMKLNDYMAVGIPVVATAVGDVATVMRQYEIGVLCEPTAVAIAQSSIQLLADPDRQRKLGCNGRRVAEQHFNWSQLSAKLLAFYERRLASN